jgi:photosystem II reaction center protein PsbP
MTLSSAALIMCIGLTVFIVPQSNNVLSGTVAQNPVNSSGLNETNSLNNENVTNSTMLSYVDEMNGISISYPPNWTFSTHGLPEYSQVVAFYSPLKNITDSIPARLSISVLRYEQNVSLKDYTNLTLTSLNASQQFKVLNSGPTTLDSKPAYKITLSTLPSMQSPLPFGLMQMWTAIGNKIYFLLYSTESSKFNSNLPTVEEMIKSMKLDGSGK